MSHLMSPRLIFWASRSSVFFFLFVCLFRRCDGGRMPRLVKCHPPRTSKRRATRQIAPSHGVTGSKLPQRSSRVLASCLLVQHSQAEIRCLPSVRRLREKNRGFFFFGGGSRGWGSLKDGGQNFEVCDSGEDVMPARLSTDVPLK